MNLPFGLLRHLRRGIKLTLYPCLRCNYDCLYCSQKTYNGEEPPPGFGGELNFSDWCGIIERFENIQQIQHITISGGEPTLRTDTSDLVNWLISRGILVSVYTNLKIDRSCSMKPNAKLRFVTTYHHHADPDEFMWMLERYRVLGHRMIVEEIGHANLPVKEVKKLGARHQVKPFEPLEDGTGGMTDRMSFAPDGSLWVWQRKMYEHLFKHYRSESIAPVGLEYAERLKIRKQSTNPSS